LPRFDSWTNSRKEALSSASRETSPMMAARTRTVSFANQFDSIAVRPYLLPICRTRQDLYVVQVVRGYCRWYRP
jgi:hypothetical protein